MIVQKTQAYWMLILVTVLWGVTFPVINLAAPFIDPALFVTIRFSLAALVMLPFIWKRFSNTNKLLIYDAIIIGFLNSTSYLTQTIGLGTVPPATAAFITGLGIVLVPLMSPLLKVGTPTKRDILAVLICLAGLYILTGANLHHLTRGEDYIFICAISYAMMIVYLQKTTQRHTDLYLLAFYEVFFCMLFTMLFVRPSHLFITINSAVISATIYCAATTIAAFVLLTYYQRFVSTTHAALIYALEPVFASIASLLLVHEIFNKNLLLGGGIMLVSLLLLSFPIASQSNG